MRRTSYLLRVTLSFDLYNFNSYYELKDFLNENLKGHWSIQNNMAYCEERTWYCNVYVQDKEDVARLRLLRDTEMMYTVW